MCTHIKVPLLRRCGLLYLDPSVQAWKQHHSKEKKWEWISVRPFLERWRKKNSCTTWGSRKAEQCRKTCISFTLTLKRALVRKHNKTKLCFLLFISGWPDINASCLSEIFLKRPAFTLDIYQIYEKHKNSSFQKNKVPRDYNLLLKVCVSGH